MNKTLQKWALKKQKILKKWSKEYHKLCVKEGFTEEPIVSMSFDGEYIGSINAMVENEGDSTFIFNIKSLFLRNGKWIGLT